MVGLNVLPSTQWVTSKIQVLSWILLSHIPQPVRPKALPSRAAKIYSFQNIFTVLQIMVNGNSPHLHLHLVSSGQVQWSPDSLHFLASPTMTHSLLCRQGDF